MRRQRDLGQRCRGVHITGGSSDNLVEGNLIGTNAAGTAAVGNGDSGVLIDGGSANNTIGGTAIGAGNMISGNGAAASRSRAARRTTWSRAT